MLEFMADCQKMCLDEAVLEQVICQLILKPIQAVTEKTKEILNVISDKDTMVATTAENMVDNITSSSPELKNLKECVPRESTTVQDVLQW